MRADRVLNWEEWRNLVVLQDHLALGIENEADIEETVLNFRMAGLSLGHNKGIILFSNLA